MEHSVFKQQLFWGAYGYISNFKVYELEICFLILTKKYVFLQPWKNFWPVRRCAGLQILLFLPFLWVLGRECDAIPLQSKCVKVTCWNPIVYSAMFLPHKPLNRTVFHDWNIAAGHLIRKEVDEAFYRQLEVPLWSQAFTTSFSHSSGKTARLGTRSRRVLQSTGDQFLTQVVRSQHGDVWCYTLY